MCIRSLSDNNGYTHRTVSTLNARSTANKSALFAGYVYQCSADLFVKTETLLSYNDPLICNAIASPVFKLISRPKSARESGDTLLLFIFVTVLLGMTHIILVQQYNIP